LLSSFISFAQQDNFDSVQFFSLNQLSDTLHFKLLEIENSLSNTDIENLSMELWPFLDFDLSIIDASSGIFTNYEPTFNHGLDISLSQNLPFGIYSWIRMNNGFSIVDTLSYSSSLSGGISLPFLFLPEYWQFEPISRFEEIERRTQLMNQFYSASILKLKWEYTSKFLRLKLLEQLEKSIVERLQINTKRIEEVEQNWLQGRSSRIELDIVEQNLDSTRTMLLSIQEQMTNLNLELGHYITISDLDFDLNKQVPILFLNAKSLNIAKIVEDLDQEKGRLAGISTIRQYHSSFPKINFTFNLTPSLSPTYSSSLNEAILTQWSLDKKWTYSFSISAQIGLSTYKGLNLQDQRLSLQAMKFNLENLEYEKNAELRIAKNRVREEGLLIRVEQLENQEKIERSRLESIEALVRAGRILEIELLEQRNLLKQTEIYLLLGMVDYIDFKIAH
jgi:hypothetical protein